MKNQENKIITRLENHLDSSKYKVYKESFKCFDDYAIINYQSNSIVDFNIPDDDMIYGIGTLIYRISDKKVFEIYTHTNEEEIMKILGKN
ncbi:MAG: hypothetical protein AB8G86_03625 [Saprospiraceae bacterium]